MIIALQGAMAVLSSSGMRPGMMAMGGPIAGDPKALGRVIASSLQLRRTLAICAIAGGIPIYWWLLQRNGCPPMVAAVLLLIGVLMLFQQIRLEIFQTTLNLNRRYHIPQLCGLLANLARGVLISLYAFLSEGDPVIYLLVSVLTLLVLMEGFLKPRVRTFACLEEISDRDLKIRFNRYMRNGLLPSLSSIFQTQLSIFLIAAFGNVSTVADLGALSRIGLIINLPLAIVNSILIPRIAAKESDADSLKLWSIAVAVSLVFAFLFFMFAWTFMGHVHLILGAEYASVSPHVPIYVLFLSSVVIFTTFGSILPARGWMKHSWARPIAVLAVQAIALPFLDLSTISGVVLLSMSGGVGYFIFEIVLVIRGAKGINTL
jgi:O-antigen/teichoic acid export membrane protein